MSTVHASFSNFTCLQYLHHSVTLHVLWDAAAGMLSYCDRYGDMIYKITSDFGPAPKWEGPTAEKIAREMNERLPVDTLPERRRWRDARLAALAKLKKELDGPKE